MTTPRPRTSDRVYAASLLALMGSDALLPDGTTVRGILRDSPLTDVTNESSHYRLQRGLRVPTDDLGTLAQGMWITIGGDQWYVAGVSPHGFGWHLATLNKVPPPVAE